MCTAGVRRLWVIARMWWRDHSAVALYAKAAMLAMPLSCLACAAQAEQLSPVAVVTEISGIVETREADRSMRLSLLSELTSGARLRLAGEAKLAVLFYDSAEVYLLNGPALARVAPASLDRLSGNEPVLLRKQTGKDGRPLLIRPSGVAQAGLVARGVTQPIAAVSVTGPIILDRRPVFRWREVSPGLAYRFVLKDAADRTVLETVVNDVALELPHGVVLRDGQYYRWSVHTRGPGGTQYALSRRFMVADEAKRTEIENFRPSQGATLGEQVAYCMWLEQNGLRDESRGCWRQLASNGLNVPTQKLEQLD